MADKIQQNEESFRALVARVNCDILFSPFEFVIRERNGDFSLQIQFYAPDNDEGVTVEKQFCRIWPLQDTMSDSEVIRTAWHAARAAVMHELEENFLVDGEAIFNPHTDFRAMVQMRQRTNIDDVRVPLNQEKEELHSETPKITYHHFVSFFGDHARSAYEHWLETRLQPDVGKYIIDGGHWRDGVMRTRRGVEFERKEDADLFRQAFGGVYEYRP